MLIISPSLLAADFNRLGEQIKKVEQAGADYLHLDVMDGIFVPNLSFGPPMIESIRKETDIFFDVHLMITDPARYIDAFVDAGADLLTIHYESCENPQDVIRAIKAKGIKVAVSIKPATDPEVLYPFLSELDMVLVMTVEPGFGGQKMMPDMLEKVRRLRAYALEHGLELNIEVDGGLTADNVKLATAAGANVIVAGSAVFRAENPAEVIRQMKEQAQLFPYGANV